MKKTTRKVKGWAIVGDDFEPRMPWFATVYFSEIAADAHLEEKERHQLKKISCTIEYPITSKKK